MTRLRHGKSKTKIYTVWESMITRCTNPNNAAFCNYGGRGIGVCEDWRLFDNFYRDMGDPPPGFSLDRIDNNAGYCPENCRWATRAEQSRNRRNIVVLTVNGETQPLHEWAGRIGLKPATIRARLKNGWSAAEAVGRGIVPQRDRHGVRWSEPKQEQAA